MKKRAIKSKAKQRFKWLIILLFLLFICLFALVRTGKIFQNWKQLQAVSLILKKQDRALSWLAALGLDLNLLNHQGMAPLHFACLVDHPATLRWMKSVGADFHLLDSQGTHCLSKAASRGNEKNVILLLEWGLDPNQCNRQGFCALMASAAQGHLTIAKTLIAFGADPNLADQSHSDSLNYAVSSNHLEMTRLLLQHMKAENMNARDINGNNAVSLAIERENLEILELLLKYGAHVDSAEKRLARSMENPAILNLLKIKTLKNPQTNSQQ